MYKKNIFRLSLSVLIVLFAVVMSACSYDEFSYYESFYEDMDISVRLEDYIRKAESGDVSRFYFDELKTLKDDLSFMPNECGQKSKVVNELFIASANMLISCYQNNKIGDAESSAVCLETAKICFSDGTMRYNDFVISK